jgi:hypothetical protein
MHTVVSLAEFAGMALVAGVWQGLVLAAAVWVCLRLVPKTSAALRFAVWSAVFVVVALLPFFEGSRAGRAGVAAGSVFAIDLRWSVGVAVVWALLSAVRAGDLVVHAVRLWSLARRSERAAVSARCAALLSAGRREVLLCTSGEVDGPSVIGFFAPRILVPKWLFEQMSEAELEQVILHEMEHLRRRDDWLNLLQKVSLVVLPLNPILLWVERRLCLERELACDDGVLRRTNAPRAYATCLTNLAERGLDRRMLSLALGALERQSELGRRVHRILRREAVLSPVQSRWLTGAVAGVLVAGSAGLARCPQLVSFVGPTQAAAVAGVSQPVMGPVAARPAGISAGTSSFPAARAMNARYVERSGMASPARFLRTAEVVRAGQVRPQAPIRHAAVRPVHRVVKPRTKEISAVRPAIAPRVVPAAAREWVMLTSWSEEERPVVMETNFVRPYAAVRVDGGWLIVQL